MPAVSVLSEKTIIKRNQGKKELSLGTFPMFFLLAGGTPDLVVDIIKFTGEIIPETGKAE
jgi:hypothetical protein